MYVTRRSNCQTDDVVYLCSILITLWENVRDELDDMVGVVSRVTAVDDVQSSNELCETKSVLYSVVFLALRMRLTGLQSSLEREAVESFSGILEKGVSQENDLTVKSLYHDSTQAAYEMSTDFYSQPWYLAAHAKDYRRV